jgi:hypothetical protein
LRRCLTGSSCSRLPAKQLPRSLVLRSIFATRSPNVSAALPVRSKISFVPTFNRALALQSRFLAHHWKVLQGCFLKKLVGRPSDCRYRSMLSACKWNTASIARTVAFPRVSYQQTVDFGRATCNSQNPKNLNSQHLNSWCATHQFFLLTSFFITGRFVQIQKLALQLRVLDL